MKRILRGFILGMVIILLIAVPVFAYYYGNLSVVESEGNDYTNLPVIASLNASMLSDYGFISATGLDTRVLTGDGVPLPHMLANDKVLFVTDLAAHEDKSLIFYMGATSLSSFPIIVGYDGYITTPDDPELELTYVMELLASGYFDASAGSDKNILYKEDAYRVYISGTSEITVAGLSAGDVEEWTMSYDSFTSGIHTVYVVSNGLGAYLYVDNFDVAKDTQNFYESSNVNLSNTYFGYLSPQHRFTFYASGRYWAFYTKSASYTAIYYKTSTDGTSWSSENTISIVAGDTIGGYGGIGVWLRGSYMHIAYGGQRAGQDYVRYRRGVPESDSTITWSADWQGTACTTADRIVGETSVVADTDDYPVIVYEEAFGVSQYSYITKSSANDGTWSTQGGYPLLIGQTSPNGNSETITAYPNSDKMYALWSQDDGASNYNWYLFGKYYNGSSWSGSDETIDYGRYEDPTYTIIGFCSVADDDDNLYIVWERSDGGSYLEVRWEDGTFSSPIQISPTGSSPSVSYNDNANCVYVTYIRSGAARSVALNLNEWEFSSEYTLFTPTGLSTLSATPYGDHVGILYLTSASGYTEHGYLSFPYEWNDNGNNWTWMQNNVMPYATDLLIAVDGTIHLEYEPADIIQGTTLPDISGASDNDGIITWGTNVDGVATSMGPLTSSSYQPPPGVTTGNWTTPQDVMPTTGGESITGGLGTLDSNVFYPVISALSYISGLLPGKDPIPIPLMWVLIASIILVIAVGVCVWKMPHQLITALVGLGLIVLFNRMGIYPWWVYLIYVPLAVSILYYERKPSL